MISKIEPLVSIIIPTFNRAHLIGETLNSVLAQTYTNWECIVVDDGSTDETDKVMADYCAKDQRFQYHHRPDNRLPGGNGARNHGLEITEGDFIIFFDSDDLMTTDHIKEKIKALINTNCDYVIAKTKNFNGIDAYLEGRYAKITNELTAENYICQTINWLTPDVCIKTKLAKSINFIEDLRSGQEFNYFSKLVLKSVNATFVDEYLTLRRIHENSIRSGLDSIIKKKVISAYTSCWITYMDIKHISETRIKQRLLFRCIDMMYKNRNVSFPFQKTLVKMVVKEFGVKTGANLILMQLFNKYFNRGYTFRKQIEKNLN